MCSAWHQVEVSSKYSTVDTLRQQYLFVPAKHKDAYLAFVMNELAGSTAMVFTRTCEATRRLALVLRNLGFEAIPISGQMSQVSMHTDRLSLGLTKPALPF